MSELTFQSSISYSAPASPPLHVMLTERKNKGLGANSLSSLDKDQTVSIHNMTFYVSPTEFCGLSFFKLIFKVYKNIFYFPFLKNIRIFTDSLIVQLVKNLPSMWETPVRFLDWEDPLEKG